MATLPGTLAVDWGGKTLKRYGGFVIPYTGVGTLTLTGTASSTGWHVEQIVDEGNITRWMLTLSGTSGNIAPAAVSGAANGATFTGTIGDGTDSCALTITIEANAYDVRPKWADASGVFEIRQTLLGTGARVQLGDKIRLRPGTYGLIAGVAPTGGQRIRFLTPQGTWTGSNYVLIAPRTPYDAVWHRLNVDPELATSKLGYLHLEHIQFTSADLTAGENPNTVAMLRTASATHYVKVTNNRFWGAAAAVVNPPSGTGYNLSQSINFSGDDWIIESNDFRDTWGAIINGPAAYNRGQIIRYNTLNRFQNDFLKFNGYEFTVTDNFATGKLHADPADGGTSGTQGSHGDFIQHTGHKDGAARTGGTVARNILVRGLGRSGWIDGQGVFFDDSANGSQLLNMIVENNVYIGTFTNGIFLRNSVSPLLRNNLIILDPTVGNTVNPNTGTGSTPPAAVRIALGSAPTGAAGVGGTVTGNISIGVNDFSSQVSPPTATNHFFLDPDAVSGATSYADNFAAPVYGSNLSSAAAVKAAFKPKVGGPIALASAGPLDTDGNFRVFTAATAVTLSGPTGGVAQVASTNFTVGADGTITGTVTVTPSDSGAGGVFTPSTVQISSASPTATFTYTPPSGAAVRTVSVTNNGALANPAGVSYQVTASPVTTVTLSVPSTLYLEIPDVIAASLDGPAPSTVTVTLDAVAGLSFGGPITIATGQSNGATTVTGTTLGVKTITGSDDAGLTGPASVEAQVVAQPTGRANRGQLRKMGLI